jgi:hypothetical protein
MSRRCIPALSSGPWGDPGCSQTRPTNRVALQGAAGRGHSRHGSWSRVPTGAATPYGPDGWQAGGHGPDGAVGGGVGSLGILGGGPAPVCHAPPLIPRCLLAQAERWTSSRRAPWWRSSRARWRTRQGGRRAALRAGPLLLQSARAEAAPRGPPRLIFPTGPRSPGGAGGGVRCAAQAAGGAGGERAPAGLSAA